MFLPTRPLGALLITQVVASGSARPTLGAQVDTDNMSRIENGLTPANRSITDRMAVHNVTGLSLVIVEANAIRWRRGYGLRQAADPRSTVSASTTFDAASVSKPIAAAAALRLVEQGRVSLTDTRILNTVPFKYMTAALAATFLQQFERPAEIDLARLLMHCAGVLYQRQVGAASRTGAQSYALNSTLPTMGQQLLGRPPASDAYKPVQTSALRPGAMFVYSGASYVLVEAVIDRYAPNGFSGYTTDLFRELGMTSSTFADYPLLATVSALRQTSRFARGHSRGTMQPARNYANHAAASLVTTTEDLARFLIMVNRNGIFDGRRVLASATVNALTGRTPTTAHARCANRRIGARAGDMGMGLRRNDTGTLHHRGTHNGYRAYIMARPANGWGMALIMTGAASDANNFAAELFTAVEKVYGFPTGTLVP